jgi:hypothetical protein
MPSTRPIFELQSAIEQIKLNMALFDEKNFDLRSDALDLIDFQVTSRIEHLLYESGNIDELLLLQCQAEKLRLTLEEVDTNLFEKLRDHIRNGKYAGSGFKKLAAGYVDVEEFGQQPQKAGYDNLDIFINGITSPQPIPRQTTNLEPEMVFYQKTPARIVFSLVEKVELALTDVFFDLGSGLGQVTILVNLLTGITAKGIEFEPAFCDYARNCAASLNLPNVTFINADAREVDFTKGTVFFMYTPFTGEIMSIVLKRLQKESRKRKIKIITYGPCTSVIALQSWLHAQAPGEINIYELAIFTSI